MSDIVLSAGVRSNLLQLEQTSELITQTQTRQQLSTTALSLASQASQAVLRLFG